MPVLVMSYIWWLSVRSMKLLGKHMLSCSLIWGFGEGVPHALSADQFRVFMHQPAHSLSGFLYACNQRRWSDPPLEVMFADVLSDDEANMVVGDSGGCSY
jgi:hypothetical protein